MGSAENIRIIWIIKLLYLGNIDGVTLIILLTGSQAPRPVVRAMY